MNQRQMEVIDYLRAENRVLREQLGGRRVRFHDDQRRRLAVKPKTLGRRVRDHHPRPLTPVSSSARLWRGMRRYRSGEREEFGDY